VVLDFPLPSPELARREIEADPACHRLPAVDRMRLGTACWRFGQEVAREWLPNPGDRLMGDIARHGARVTIDEAGLGAGGGFVSEYRQSGAIIVLHRGALAEWARASGRPYPDLVQVALAHEFFHHLECGGAIDLRPTASISRPSLVRRTPRLIVPRGAIEACAHGFTSLAAGTYVAESR
jgi:hypothetical protein